MNVKKHNLSEDDHRVLRAARHYLGELEAGRKPARKVYLARYPELAKALNECFDGIDLAQSLRPATALHAPLSFTHPLGDFRIVRELGRGGMGAVYEAEQLSLRRRVALKVLPFAAALHAKHLQRFKTEAHAAAQLHHSNIVPIYAVGCERGVHFYAMQLIEGRSLAAVIQDLRGESFPEAGERSAHDRQRYRSTARMIANVADALEYAHGMGVIHRDIKPANLLLDAKGTVWITDFGLAQVSAEAGLTQTGDLLGTLRYMSPEQAAGQHLQMDHRTDIYSLGATLYELLTLEPVFPGDDRQTLLRQILDADPIPLRRIVRSIPVELETIVLKALSKNPADRYATAGELAADLRRFLDDRPIMARRPSAVDRIRKGIRRHPSLVAAAALLLIFSVVGLSVTTALVAREQALTQDAYMQERKRAQEAEEQFLLARRSVDELIQLAEDELAGRPDLDGLRKRILQTALAYYQEFIELRRDHPNAQEELAATRDRIKKILEQVTLWEQRTGESFPFPGPPDGGRHHYGDLPPPHRFREKGGPPPQGRRGGFGGPGGIAHKGQH